MITKPISVPPKIFSFLCFFWRFSRSRCFVTVVAFIQGFQGHGMEAFRQTQAANSSFKCQDECLVRHPEDSPLVQESGWSRFDPKNFCDHDLRIRSVLEMETAPSKSHAMSQPHVFRVLDTSRIRSKPPRRRCKKRRKST